MSDIQVDVTAEPKAEPIAETEPNNVVVVTDTGTDDTASLVTIAATLGQVVERLNTIEANQTVLASRLASTEATADVAVTLASEATSQVEEATEQAIEAIAETSDKLDEDDVPPQRDHWFFRKYRVTT